MTLAHTFNKLVRNRFLKSILLCLVIIFIFSILVKINLARSVLHEMEYSDLLWESLDAKYFATTGDFEFSFRSYPSENILMPHFAKTHFLIHSYIVGLVSRLTKIDVLPLWKLYGFLFYVLGMASIFYLLWVRFSLFTAFITVVIGFFNKAFLPFLFYSLSDNSQIAAFISLIIVMLLYLNKRFIFIWLLFIYVLLTSFSVGSSVAVFLILFYSLNLFLSLKNNKFELTKKFFVNIFLIFATVSIVYLLLYNNLTSSYLKTVIVNSVVTANSVEHFDNANFTNLGFLYIIALLIGIFIFLRKNLKRSEFHRQILLLATSMFMLVSYVSLFFLRELGMDIDNRIWNIFCIRYYIYTLPMLFFVGYAVHYFTLKIRFSGSLKYIIYLFLLIGVLFMQKSNYVYSNIQFTDGGRVAFCYIVNKYKKMAGFRHEIPKTKPHREHRLIYDHMVDRSFYKTKLGAPYNSNFVLERKIAGLISDNCSSPPKNIVVNSKANGAKIALTSGCFVLSEYITPRAWEILFISNNQKATYDILRDPDKYSSEYISDFEGYFHLPQVVKSLPSSARNYGGIDFVIFYYKQGLNLEKGLNKFLRNHRVYKLIKEYSIVSKTNLNDAEEKVFIFKVL